MKTEILADFQICVSAANQMDWFLYDNGLRHERVKEEIQNNSKVWTNPL